MVLDLPMCCIRVSPTLPLLILHNDITAFNLTGWLNEPYECFNAQLFDSRRAKIGHCYRVMAALPNYHEPRLFINGEGDPDLNPYLLPYTATKLGCQIKVEMVFGVEEEESTWLSINVAASKVLPVRWDAHISVTIERAQRAIS